MVTDSVAYVGTSNWSADYFTGTAGIGYVINETETGNTVRAQLQAVFERNWDSNFTVINKTIYITMAITSTLL